jgi:hypothetical protein
MRALFIRVCIVVALITGIVSFLWHPALWSLVVTGPLCLLGIIDMIQPSHSIKRNYPIVGRMRYWAEWMRPKIYQYFIESDTDGTPFNRLNRSVIYQRAKKVMDTTPFGTQLNVYEVGYE